MRIALIHNQTAGDGAFDAKELARLFQEASHDVDLFGKRKDDVTRAILSRADVLAVAGGDGTVATTAVTLDESGADTPLFILPVGTSNNIARSLGIQGPIAALVRAFAAGPSARLDIGSAKGPWGTKAFVEGAGVGFIGAMLSHRPGFVERISRSIQSTLMSTERLSRRKARGVARLIRRQPVMRFEIIADGEDLSGEYVAVEAMNIREIGPRIALAPSADPGDGLFDLVRVRPEGRTALADYVARRVSVAWAPGVDTRRVRSVELSWPERDGHLDDTPWPSIGSARGTVRLGMAGGITVLGAAHSHARPPAGDFGLTQGREPAP